MGSRFPRIHVSRLLERTPTPSDGNCLFTSLSLGRCLGRGQLGMCPLPFAHRAVLGERCRAWFLDLARQKFSEGAIIHDDLTWQAALIDNLWDTPEAYISAMSPPIGDRSQWGGFAEAIAIAHYWNTKIVFFDTCATQMKCSY